MSTRFIDSAAGTAATDVSALDSTPVHSRSKRALALKLDLSTRLCRVREGAGLAQKEVARQQLASAWEDSDEPHAPNAIAVVCMPERARPVAVETVRFQADHLDLDVLERARVLHGDNHLQRLSVITSTDTARVLASALADGELTDDEIEAIRLEADKEAEEAREASAWAVQELLRRRGAR